MSLIKPKNGWFEFRIDLRDRNWCDRDQDFINEVKTQIPSESRSFSSVTKIWRIKEPFYPVVRQLRCSYYGEK